MSTSDLNSWIAAMMRNLEMDDYTIRRSGNSEKGDGYLGEITFVTVTTPSKTFDLVVKFAKKSRQLRQLTPIKDVYDREIFFHGQLYPILRELQREAGIMEGTFDKVPKCYYVHSEETKEAIVLEDLKRKGFDVYNGKETMDMDHVLMVVENYAKYHALSMALRQKKPAVFKSATKNMSDVLGKFFIQGQMLGIFTKEFELVKKLLRDEPNVLNKYEGFAKTIEDNLLNISDHNCEPAVILHGDCWNNNYMFKEDSSKPIDMRFLDFQLSRVASPILDLSYFIYACAGRDVLARIDHVLAQYHVTLTAELRRYNESQTDDPYPLRKLTEQWKRYGRFGLTMSLLGIKLALLDHSEAPDLIDATEGGKDLGDALNFQIADQGEYERRLKDVFVHFAERFM